MQAILLAAGLSKRMGRQKLLLPFGSSTVVETVIDNIRSAGFAPMLCVFSQETYDFLKDKGSLPVSSAINKEPERGQSSSLLIGLDMLPDGSDFCIMLGDLPSVTADEISALAKKFADLPRGKTILAPSRDGRFGHPMFFRSVWKERFTVASGDVGGRKIILEHEREIARVASPDAHFADLDTPDDYKRLLDKGK